MQWANVSIHRLLKIVQNGARWFLKSQIYIQKILADMHISINLKNKSISSIYLKARTCIWLPLASSHTLGKNLIMLVFTIELVNESIQLQLQNYFDLIVHVYISSARLDFRLLTCLNPSAAQFSVPNCQATRLPGCQAAQAAQLKCQ